MKEGMRQDLPQLWSAIGHEIRTPLNVIKGMAAISANEIYDVDLMRDCMNKIMESTEHMQDVVNSMIDYAAITQRNIEILNAKMDFKTLVTEIAMRSYILAKQKKCHFNMHVQDVSEEALIGDEARISQVLLALLKVVVRYTASDGMIDFAVHQVGVSNSKVYMRFCLRSTALEFPDEIAAYLNDNSLYINPDILAPVGAFGITEMNALYISYLMGGKIEAHNEKGEYSEIIFDMEFGRTEQPYSVNGAKLFEHQRILIVADTQEMCEERGKMLVDMGMDYEYAVDADDALEKIGEAESNKQPFTICIIDWEMQNKQCSNLMKGIRDIFGQELTIIVTAHAPSEHIKEAKHYGANYVIDRTIFRSTLFDALISIEKGMEIHQVSEDSEKYDFTGSRVLVAEDVALNMEVITKLLSRVHIEVTCVEDGLEAVTEFKKKPEGFFDAIFLDINMPMMDGYAATEAIRKSNKSDSKTVPIYAMTANAFREDVEKALEVGMDGHIAKPIDVTALYRILSQILDKKDGNEIEKLRNLAEQDPLTGCLNRRGFENHMNRLINHKMPIAYIAIDVDDFKQINDRFGHEMGDEILKKIVRILKHKFRSTDCFVRFGGDEFAVVLIDFKKQANFLKRRMDEVNEELLHPTDGLPPVSVSVGAVISANGYKQDLYSTADKALYQSKHAGKGTCFVMGSDSVLEDDVENEELIYAEGLHYLNDSIKVIVQNKQQIRSALMVKNKPVGYVNGFCDTTFSIYSFNGFFPELLGYTKKEFSDIAINGFTKFVHPDDAAYLLKNYELEIMQVEKLRLLGKDGDYIWFNMDYLITKTADGQSFWMASLKNIDDNLVGSLCEDDYRLVATIEPDKGTVMIEKGAYLASERELNIQKKYNYKLLVEDAIADTVKPNDREHFMERASLKNICQKLSFGGIYEFNVYQKWGKDDYCVVRHKYRYMIGKKNTILCTWELLGYRAEIDELTDTYNEAGFYRMVEELLKKSKSGEKYTILFFDISGFKAWNSMLGKDNADELLKVVARSLQKSELKPIITSRLLSDHFVCLIEKERCNLNIISHLCKQQFGIDGNNVALQMRCGIFDVDDTSESVRSMCDKAKLATAHIENEYAVPYQLFDAELRETYFQHKHVINQVAHALERKEIKVYYQPIVDAKTRQIVSAEALIRWILPGGLMMSPAVFVPALEEQGHIADVDSYVQSSVCAMLESRNQEDKRIVPVSVNVSRMDFLNTDFVEKIKGLATTMESLNDYMRLEVTESSFSDIGKHGENLLRNLRERGIEVLMDDFGTGVSTLSGLTSQQFDIIKMDMSFVRGIGKGIGTEAVIQNVISMCHALDMKVVAEGVENEEQYQFLCESDCDYIQGYFFYKPMPEHEFEELLDQESAEKEENPTNN